ncbi:MAG: Monooxygenase, FAD-binding, partial [Hyphomicrobiales bacterium]|nr:Monooxygenase, FAD-binding [Hyphomicrobiales bacterium]
PPEKIAAFESAARELNIPLKVVRDDQSGERTKYEARLILVRPDQYVVWHDGINQADASTVLAKVVGH